jgi:hypothetical protein
MLCPACGAENRFGAKFCNECGAALSVAPQTVSPEPGPDPIPEPVKVVRIDPPPPPLPVFEAMPPRDPSELPPTHPEWRMSSAGPLPEPPRRRLWLWIVGGLLGCVVMAFLMNAMLMQVAQNAGAP